MYKKTLATGMSCKKKTLATGMSCKKKKKSNIASKNG